MRIHELGRGMTIFPFYWQMTGNKVRLEQEPVLFCDEMSILGRSPG